MLTSEYKEGETIYEILQKVRHIETVLGIEDGGSLVSTNNVTVNSLFEVPYTNSCSVLFTDINHYIVGRPLIDIVLGTPNQTSITDLGEGRIRIDTLQNLDAYSDINFNNLKLSGTLQVSPINKLTHTSGFEMIEPSLGNVWKIQRSDNLYMGPGIILQKSRGTILNPTNTLNNDILGVINFDGFDGTTWKTATSIIGQATEDHTSTNTGTKIIFQNTLTNNANPQNILQIDHDGIIHHYNTTQSTSTSTGSLVINGGVSVAKNLNIAGNLQTGSTFIPTILYLISTQDSSSISTGTLTVPGGVGIGKSLVVEGTEYILSTNNATDTQTGSLIINGGLGVEENIYIGGSLTHMGSLTYPHAKITATTVSTDATTGSLVISGGVSVANDLYISGIVTSSNLTYDSIDILSTIDTSSVSTGALVVNGGVGIGKSLVIGDDLLLGTDDFDMDSGFLMFNTTSSGYYSYICHPQDSLLMTYNGWAGTGGSSFSNNDPSKYSSWIQVRRGQLSFCIGPTVGARPVHLLDLYNSVIHMPSTVSGNSTINTESDGTTKITATGKRIIIGANDTDINNRFRFTGGANVGGNVYGYLSNYTDEFNMSYNGYWNGTTWGPINPYTYTSGITLTDGFIYHKISTSVGIAPRIISSLDYNNEWKLYYANPTYDNSIYTGLIVDSTGILSIYPTGDEIQLGSSSTDYHLLQFPNGYGPPSSYLRGYVNASGKNFMMMAYGGLYNTSTGWTRDPLRYISHVSLEQDQRIGFAISPNINTDPSRLLNLEYDGTIRLYCNTDESKFSTLKTSNTGSLAIQSSNNIIFANTQSLNILNTTDSTSTSTGALQVYGGLNVPNSNISNFGTLDVQNYGGRTCNMTTGNLTVKDNLILWRATGTPAYTSGEFTLYGSGDTRGLAIGNHISSYVTGYTYIVRAEMPTVINNASIQLWSYGEGITILNVSSTGQLNIDVPLDVGVTSGEIMHIHNTTIPTDTLTGALVTYGGITTPGMMVGGTPLIGQTDVLRGKIFYTKESLMFWSRTSNSIDSYFLFNLQDRQFEGENDNRQLVISNGGGNTNVMSMAPFYDSMSLTYGGGNLTGTPVGTVSISGNKLSIGATAESYVSYSATGNCDFTNTGAIKFKLTPKYSGIPSTFRSWININNGDTTTNQIWLRHEATIGLIRVIIRTSTASLIMNYGFGNWTTNVSGTEYEIELNIDITTGATRLFIDGTQFGGTATNTGTRTSPDTLIVSSRTYPGDCYIRDLMIFSTVQHTTNYTPGYSIPSIESISTPITPLHQNIYFDGSGMRVKGLLNPLPSNNWIILAYSSTNVYDCFLILKTPDGRQSEVIIRAETPYIDIQSREYDFSGASSGRIVVSPVYGGDIIGNNVTPTEFQSVVTYTTQIFTIATNTKARQISFWAYSSQLSPYTIDVTIYEGVGTSGTIKSISRVLISSVNKKVNCILPGSITLNAGTYTMSISSNKSFYIGNTVSSGETTFYVDGTLKNDKLMSYTIEQSTSLAKVSYMVLAKRAVYGTTYEIRLNHLIASYVFIDTGSSILYTNDISYDNQNPSTTPFTELSENVIISTTVDSTSRTTGSLIVEYGMGIGKNLNGYSMTIEKPIDASVNPNTLLPIFGATFNTTIDADIGRTPTGTAVGGAIITSGKLDLRSSTNRKYVYYDTTYDFIKLTTDGYISFFYTPNYSGSPTYYQVFFSISDGTTSLNNRISLWHNPAGQLFGSMWSSTGVQTPMLFGTWSPTSGTEYEFIFRFNLTGYITLAINYVQFSPLFTFTGSRTNTCKMCHIGADNYYMTLYAHFPNFMMRNFTIHDYLVETIPYPIDTSAIFSAPFESNMSAQVSSYPYGVSTGVATITGGKLDLRNATVPSYVLFDGRYNLRSVTQKGTVKFFYTPNYTGYPTISNSFMFDFSKGTGSGRVNYISMFHNTDGLIQSYFSSVSNVVLVTLSRPWSVVAGMEYEMELNFDYNVGCKATLFINGNLWYSSNLIGSRTNDIDHLCIGSTATNLSGTIWYPNFRLRHFSIYNYVMHNTNYVSQVNPVFVASYVNSIDANIGTSPTGTSVGGAVITDKKLDLTNSVAPKYIYYVASANLIGLTQTGTINFRYIPNYSGTPSTHQVMFSTGLNNTDTNHLILYHSLTTGYLHVKFNDSSGTIIIDNDFIYWNPISGTEYELELNYDCETRKSARLFIDGKFMCSMACECSRSNNITNFYIGTDSKDVTNVNNYPNFYLKNLSIYHYVKHTESYIYNPNLLFYDSFSYVPIPEIAVIPEYTITGKGHIANGRLDLTNSTTTNQVSFDAPINLTHLTQQGTIKLLYTPNYTGRPLSHQIFLKIDGTDSDIQLTHNQDNGHIAIYLKCNTVVIHNYIPMGQWSPIAGTEYEVCFCYDCNTFSNTRLFINGVQFGTTLNSKTSSVMSVFSNIVIGYFWINNFYLRNLAIYNTVLYTSNYTPTDIYMASNALTVAGGLGCADILYPINSTICYGNMLTVSCHLSLNYTSASSADINYHNTHGIQIVSMTNLVHMDAGSKLYIPNTLDATSPTQGCLIVTGGMNVGKLTYVGSTVDSTSTATGALVNYGGAGIAKNLYVGESVYVRGRNIFEYLNYVHLSKTFDDRLLEFTERTIPINTINGDAMAFSPQLGLYLIGGTNTWTEIMRSRNGIDWELGSCTHAVKPYNMVWCDKLGIFVITGRNYIITSPDSYSWTIRYTDGTSVRRALCWSPEKNLIVSIGMTAGIANRCVTSSDGITWTPNTGLDDVTDGDTWQWVIYANRLGLFVACGQNATLTVGRVAYSSDAINWTRVSVAYGNRTIAWSPEMNMLIMLHTANVVWYSYDAANWAYKVVGHNHSVTSIYVPDYHMFLTHTSPSGPTQFMYSYDGFNWTYITIPYTMIERMYASSLKQLVYTTSGPKLYTSTPIYEKQICPITVDSTSSTTGSLIVYGGVGIYKNLNVGGATNISDTTNSTSTSTGSLLVSGGMGISGTTTINGDLNVGTNFSCGNVNFKGINMSSSSVSLDAGSWTGPVTLSRIIYCMKIGNVVSIYCDYVSGTSTATGIFYYNINLSTGLYNKSSPVYLPIRIVTGAIAIVGILYIATDGGLQIWAGPNPTDTFSIGINIGIQVDGNYMV